MIPPHDSAPHVGDFPGDGIHRAFEMMACSGADIGRQEWSVRLVRSGLVASARIRDGWLQVSAPLAPLDQLAAGGWALLEANASLGGLGKFGLELNGDVSLRAEIPVRENAGLLARLLAACAAFEEAAGVIGRSRMDGDLAPASRVTGPSAEAPAAVGSTTEAPGAIGPSAEAPAAPPLDLKAVCVEAGWVCHDRTGGRLAVDLGVRGFTQPAILEPEPAGGVRLMVELARPRQASAVSRRALAHFLLRASRGIHMVRAAAFPETNGTPAWLGLIVRLETAPAAPELEEALSALAAAARLCGREAGALLGAATAAAYISVLGAPPPAAVETVTCTT